LLDAFIIEELKRKERQQEREAERPQLPVPSPKPVDDEDDQPRQSDDGKPQRGVVIIDYSM
jgi:hypothetical protein